MNWYELQITRGYLGQKRRPDGANVLAPMAGIPYRVPLSEQGHIIGYEQVASDDPTFICGRGVYPDGDWFVLSGAHHRWGEDPYLIADTRSSGTCPQCKTGWQAELARRAYEKTLKPKEQPETQAITIAEYRERYAAEWQMEEMKLRMQASWVAQMLGGEIVDE